MNKRLSETFQIEFDLDGVSYSGEAIALTYKAKSDTIPDKFSILLNRNLYFHLERMPDGWKTVESGVIPQILMEEVGRYINNYYE